MQPLVLSIITPLPGWVTEHAMKLLHMNLVFAWAWVFLGFLSGMVLGLFFHRENWLGGYGSLQRRMYRLGHISFFGLGAVNLLFWLTMSRLAASGPYVSAAAWAFIIGGITMPLCCVVMAHHPKQHLIFTVPVVSLLLAGALTLVAVIRQPTQPEPGGSHLPLNPHLSTLNQP